MIAKTPILDKIFKLDELLFDYLKAKSWISDLLSKMKARSGVHLNFKINDVLLP